MVGGALAAVLGGAVVGAEVVGRRVVVVDGGTVLVGDRVGDVVGTASGWVAPPVCAGWVPGVVGTVDETGGPSASFSGDAGAGVGAVRFSPSVQARAGAPPSSAWR